MRHEFGFQFEFRQLLEFSQQPIRSAGSSNSDLSSFGKESRAFSVQSSAVLRLRRWKASSVGLVQSEYFGRSHLVTVVPEWLLERIVRCVPGVSQTLNDEIPERHGLITKLTSPTSLNYRSDVGMYQLVHLIRIKSISCVFATFSLTTYLSSLYSSGLMIRLLETKLILKA